MVYCRAWAWGCGRCYNPSSSLAPPVRKRSRERPGTPTRDGLKKVVAISQGEGTNDAWITAMRTTTLVTRHYPSPRTLLCCCLVPIHTYLSDPPSAATVYSSGFLLLIW